ncbi:MAG: type IVB secretion system protein IcmH/DotU [Formivibrio sp.]|nr:type IVB secretion system protein IcmH/DotU [Formivibrio sp.]
MSTVAATDPSLALTIETPRTPCLRDLFEDGIYLLFLLRDGNAPNSASEFNRRVDEFLASFDRNAHNFGKSVEAVQHAKYAFCALMDEIILSSSFSLREEWERAPLQLRLFGEHLAGEGFFERLERLRFDPAKHVEELEVFHTCILLGFQGKYLLEGSDKLAYLAHRLGQEIQQVRGGRAEFAPNWKLPLRFQQYVKNELPLWLYFALLSIVLVTVFVAYHFLLGGRTELLSHAVAFAPATSLTASAVTANP